MLVFTLVDYDSDECLSAAEVLQQHTQLIQNYDTPI